MTDYETAALEISRAALEVSRAGLWAAYAQAGVALFVGLVQGSLIYYGIQLMRRNADHRDAQHKETMTALEQQGKALAQQGEALAQQREALAQQGEALAQQGEALRALIARTAPKD